jgi:hypothetical protein
MKGKTMGFIRRLRLLAIAILALLAIVLVGQQATVVPSATPSQALAQNNPPPQELAPALPMVGGQFEDPQSQFQVGILDGYQVSMVSGSPLFQAADGSLAYTVVVVPQPAGTPDPLPDRNLALIANETFSNGEGFMSSNLQTIPGGGIQLDWIGRLSQGNTPPQPIAGKVFVNQRGSNVYLLLVAATEAGRSQVNDAITTLGGTLRVP